MKNKRIMAVIHIIAVITVLGGAFALCGCSGSNFDSAVGGGGFASSNGGCISSCAACVGSSASTLACAACTGCAVGCLGFFE